MASAAGMTLSQFETLLNATDPDFKPDKLAMTLNYRKYEVTNTILPKFKKIVSGTSYETHVQVEDATNGGHTGMFFVTDVVNLYDTDQTLTSNYRHYINSCSYDKAQLSINSGDRVKRYDYMKSQRMAMHRKTADDLKAKFWSAPASSSDTTSPFGPLSWIVMGTDGDTGSFSGSTSYYLDGNTFDVGGLSRTTYPKLCNYYADHNGNLNETFLDLLSMANLKTSFEVPLVPNIQKIDGVDTRVPQKVVYYTSANVIQQVEKIARNSDDRLGYDLGKYNNETTYKGIPFRYNEIFDTTSTCLYGTDPLLAINWDVIYPIVVKDWYFVSTVQQHPFAHNCFNEFIDLYWGGVHSDNPQQSGFLISQHT